MSLRTPPPTFPTDDPAADLRPRLTHDDPTVRRLALIELAEWEDDQHLPWLHWALRDTDDAVRAEAAHRLVYREDTATLEALVQALADASATVREAAAQTLAELKETDSAVPLLAALQAPHDTQAPATPHAAFRQASLLRALRELRATDALAPALDLAHAPDALVRREAVGVLGWLKPVQALPTLTALAHQDGDADVRRAAVGALGFAEGPAAPATVLQALLTALGDPIWQVREEAATTLAKLKPAAAQAALLSALQDGYWQVRLRATRALGRLKDPSAVTAISLGPLRHEEANLRKEAAVALGEIADAAATEALLSAQLDTDPEVRKAARMALASIEAAAAQPAR